MSGNEEFFDSASSGESFPSVRFPEVGKSFVKGTVITTPVPVKRPDLNDSTKLVEQLPVNLRIEGTAAVKDKERGEFIAGDGESVTLWVGAGFLAGALKEALADVGRKGLVAGMKVTVAFIEERPTKYPKPAKVYKAKVELPAETGTSITDIFGDSAELVS